MGELISAVETDAPDTADAALPLETIYEKLQHGLEHNAFVVDFKHAYENIPTPDHQNSLATIILVPPDGPPILETLRTQPFGPKSAPANLARISALLRWISAHLLNANLLVYLGDFSTVEEIATTKEDLHVTRDLFSLRRLHIEELKERRPAGDVALLWPNVRFSSGSVRAPLPDRKAADYAD